MRLVLTVVLAVLLVALDARAAILVVNTTADTFDGVCDAADCSIKDAVFEAESNGQADVVELQPGATYLVNTPYATPFLGAIALPEITTQIAVNGHGATIQRAAAAPDMRFFEVDTGGHLTLRGLTLRDGRYLSINRWGGAIFAYQATLVTEDCFFIGNSAMFGSSGMGGAVTSQGGTVQFIRTSFIGNRASGSAGAWYATVAASGPSNLLVDGCAFQGNQALAPGQGGRGGAILLAHDQTTRIANSTFVGNTAVWQGGAIMTVSIPVADTVELVNVTIVGNTAYEGAGISVPTCSGHVCPLQNEPILTNVVLANNLNAAQDPNCIGTYVSVGHNIIGGPNANCTVTAPTNPPDYNVTTLPGLAVLKDTGDAGGMYRRPVATCLAVDNGDGGACSALDQLSLPRAGAACEIGAVEYHPCVPPGDRLTGWWPFDEISGTTALDIAGSIANTGVYVNGVASTPKAMVNRAHCFDGLTQHVTVNDHPDMDLAGDCALGAAEPFTLDVWVKTFARGVQPLVDKRESAANFLRGYYLFVRDGQLGFQMANGPGNSSCGSPGSACADYLAPSVAMGGIDLADDRWHHVAVVVTRCPTALGQMFIDGVLAHSFVPLVGDMANASALLVGAAHPIVTAIPPFNGCLDELELFKRALTPLEVQALHAAGWAGKCKPLGPIAVGHGTCVSSHIKNLTQIARMQGKAVRACVKDHAAGNLDALTPAECLRADRGGTVAKAAAKGALGASAACSGVVAEFGPEDAAAVTAAAVDESLGLANDVLGADPDTSLALRSTDLAAATCQDSAVKGMQGLVATELKIFAGCSRKLLKAGLVDDATLAACVDDVAEPASVAASASQPGGKVADAAAKLAATLAKKCGGLDLTAVLPGACAAATPTALGTCVQAEVACRVCRMVGRANQLDVDCDAFDDGTANASCGL